MLPLTFDNGFNAFFRVCHPLRSLRSTADRLLLEHSASVASSAAVFLNVGPSDVALVECGAE